MLNIPDGDRMKGAVLFPVATRNNRLILATASHTVTGMRGQYEMIIADSSGSVLPASKSLVKTMILPPEMGTDLALMEMSVDELPALVRLSDRTPSKGMTLCHARNVMFKNDFKDQTFVVSEQSVASIPRRFTFANGDYFDVREHHALIGQAAKNPLRGLAMQSWPGVSGSPIWDSYGNVLGMVCGGNGELSESEPEFFVVYLPAKEIKKNLERFIK